ncbi:hypothetical protein SAMN02910456_01016 [Ruminococcaceae bacterium YRB3002]|nr:hypothetical protein SAMN02910456_01016 [Ruminococcaceae bacterium YRB3002]
MKLVDLTCPNCNGKLQKEGDNIICQSCGAVFALDYDESDVEHEKLLTEEERAKREFEHEKELLEIKHRQEQEARIAAEKREQRRQTTQSVKKYISNKVSALIGLLIVVGFFYGSYKLCVHWGVVPPMKDIIASATASNRNQYAVEAADITSDMLENMISAGQVTKLNTHGGVRDLVDNAWVDYSLDSVEYDSAYFISNASQGQNRVVIIYKLNYTSSIGDKVTYDGTYFDGLKYNSDDSVVCDYEAEAISRSKAAWHRDSYVDREQCYRENVLAFGGTVTELQRSADD